MSLQICLLKTGETIIGDVREVIDQEKNEFLGYKVADPFVIELTNVPSVSVADDVVEPNDHNSTKVLFRQWSPLADSMEFQFTKEFVEVIYPPCHSILNSYISIIADYKQRNTVTATIDPNETVLSGEGGVPMDQLQTQGVELSGESE